MSTIDEIESRHERRKNLFSNYDYVNWLIDFTNKHSDSFVIEDCNEYYQNLSKEDKEKIANFYCFFSGLDDYAYRNDIIPNYSELGVYYVIGYDEYAFIIGIDGIGQGSFGYVEKTISDEKVIPYEIILDDYKKVFDQKCRVLERK